MRIEDIQTAVIAANYDWSLIKNRTGRGPPHCRTGGDLCGRHGTAQHFKPHRNDGFGPSMRCAAEFSGVGTSRD